MITPYWRVILSLKRILAPPSELEVCHARSLISGDMEKMCADAPRVFAIYQRGMSMSQTGEMTGGAMA
ncbi:MAG: hypothetical protein QNK42_13740 [Pseudodonghicola sp.]|nr:hypothetical protein [Pseudodonghicola sp.]